MNSVLDSASSDEVSGILANDTLPEGVKPMIEVMSMPENGILELNTETGEFVYTPNQGFAGEDSFEYALVKANGITDSAKVTFIVKEVEDDSDDVKEVAGGSTVKLQLRAGEISKIYAEAGGKRFRMRLRKGKDEAEALFSKKCHRHRIKPKELLNAVPGEDKTAAVVVEKKDGTKEVITVTVSCPKVENVYMNENGEIIADGKYFGEKPKAYLLDEEDQKLIKLKILKKQLRYRNSKGKPVCMDGDTGASEAVMVPKKELVHSRYKLMIMNNVGIGADVETEAVPELILE
jgi:hypothetical protein